MVIKFAQFILGPSLPSENHSRTYQFKAYGTSLKNSKSNHIVSLFLEKKMKFFALINLFHDVIV
ncbi:MAG: hypothetical protein CL401_08885 [Acidiferrobacteraceae bacterium]|nr:hypothetical protein [Acidiferrobacteraceae bacterium]